MDPSAKVSIIIPAYNEAQSIGSVVEDVASVLRSGNFDYEIIVIDDGSSDNTAQEAARAGATVFRHPYNIGNGAAVKSGIRAAQGEVFVFMDGDGQHDPSDIARMLEHIPDYDMVVGARSFEGQASFWRALGNKAFNWFASYVAKFRIPDLTSGFRAVKADIARSFVYLLPNTYSYPTTITLGVLRSGNSVKYLPIHMRRRQTGSSQVNMVRDGVRFFMIITRICTLYSPMRIFLPVSFLMFLLGTVNYAITYFSQGRFTNMSALLYATSILIFMMSLISEQICQMRFERRATHRPAAKPFPANENRAE
ncbi:glycosyltransferase family 2 protein [Desulfoferrobacter suflitae]|uniref:glycosyltransferase family 2 protein n=1 Tax=Desulfoferrobacter suflitae TaxID=2865782 RepID=UPI002164CB9A|nr:glycosyltransferase family 2 protein [Desulfoferrobacter suflitae]MCK8600197.1 glycosyltransferase family 2 protein [Desulfoferrobacter suflitae]